MSAMDAFKKSLSKRDDVQTELLPPSYFLHSGNYSLNKLMSGNFSGGLPQGRLVCLAGHSSAGKSLVAASVAAAVIDGGGDAYVLDSETSLDDDFMRNCGVDVDSDRYQYVGVNGISQTTSLVNEILKLYKKNPDSNRAVIIVDSLDMLLTDTESKRLEDKGDIGGDQGQQAKQLKATLKTWVHSVSSLPVTIVCTKQPYQEQDAIKAMSEPWRITPSLQFAFSQVIIFEKLQFKDASGQAGFTLKARSFKNRFAREKQVVKVEIPYDNGMDPFSGLFEIAEEYGVIAKNGGWYTPTTFEGAKFQKNAAAKDLEFMAMLLEEIRVVDTKHKVVNADLSEYETTEDVPEDKTAKKNTIKQKRKERE